MTYLAAARKAGVPLGRAALRNVAALLLPALVSSPVLAGKWPEATAHIFESNGSQDAKAGHRARHQAAEADNPEAQYALARLHRQGGLIRKNAAKSGPCWSAPRKRGFPKLRPSVASTSSKAWGIR